MRQRERPERADRVASDRSRRPRHSERRTWEGVGGAWLVGAAGLGVGVLIALRVLIPHHMDPTIFVDFGVDAPIQTAYGRALLGEVTVRQGYGHDGKFFFAQANDPWYLAPERNAVVLDRPLYRAQRMLFPTIAGGFGLFPPNVIVWSMLIVNVLGLAVGAFIGAKLAIAWGGPAWLGLWVPLNVGLLFELDIGGSGILAYVCCLAALWALVGEKAWLASALLAAGALGRETMLAFAVGVFLLWWLERRRPTWPLVVVPAVASAVWTTYLLFRLEGISGSPPELGNFGGLPFVGILGAVRLWLRSPVDLVFGLVVLAVVIAFVPLALRSRLPIAWGALPFAGLLVVLSTFVLHEPFDLSRVVAPIFTAFPFLILATSPSRRGDIDFAVARGNG
jgi:hypothetical protein